MDAALLRQWSFLQREVIPPLVRVSRGRPATAWSLGAPGDAVALAVAFDHASGEGGALRVFSSIRPEDLRRVSFRFADVRHLPVERRDASLCRQGTRWAPTSALAEQILLREPPDPVDLLAVRCGDSGGTVGPPRPGDRLRPGGHLLLVRSSTGDPHAPHGMEELPCAASDCRLYRKPAAPDLTASLDAPHGTEVAVDSLAERCRREALVTGHIGLAKSLARRFANRGEPVEDLEQVALLALVKASRNYDPTRDTGFAGFAAVCILGELKRHFRDKTWSLSVPRRLQNLYLAIKRARDELTQQYRQLPTVGQIAAHLGVPQDAVLEALEAADSYWPHPLDTRDSEDGAGAGPASEEPGYDHSLELCALQALWPRLDRREQLVIRRTCLEGRTQKDVATEIGVSQMQVSRILAHAIGRLHHWAEDDRPRAAGGARAPARSRRG